MLLKKGSRGEDVKKLQRLLHLYEDGIFGPMTEEAVRAFQKKNNLKVDGIVGDTTWSLLCGNNLVQSKRLITKIIVHCSATKEGKDYTAADIRQWHLARGFSDIGYHYVVYRDGTVQPGRNVNIAGAHCLGQNTNSIGVCYIGGLDSNNNPKDTRTPAQKQALIKLLTQLKKMYPKATIHGHNEYANKACPCFNAFKEYSSIK